MIQLVRTTRTADATVGYMINDRYPGLRLESLELPYDLGQTGHLDDSFRAIPNGYYRIFLERVVNLHWIRQFRVSARKPWLARIDRFDEHGIPFDWRLFIHYGWSSTGCILVPDVRSNDDILEFIDGESILYINPINNSL